MTSASNFKRRIWTEADRRSIEIGAKIHQAVIDEGRREGVLAYMYQSEDGRSWFEKYDRRTKTLTRNFSSELADRMKRHRADLKIYAEYYRGLGFD